MERNSWVGQAGAGSYRSPVLWWSNPALHPDPPTRPARWVFEWIAREPLRRAAQHQRAGREVPARYFNLPGSTVRWYSSMASFH